MMDGTFVTELGKALPRPVVCKVNGEEHLLVPKDGGTWIREDLDVPDHLPTPLVFGTLGGLAGYLNKDGAPDLLVHVRPEEVNVFGPLRPRFGQRAVYASAMLEAFHDASPFPFGRFLDPESFVIEVQKGFVTTASRDQVLAVVGTVRDENVRLYNDDGVTQALTVKAGLGLKVEAVPNPILLAPWRTFREVEQPESLFILRARRSGEGEMPSFALFLADGGTWKLEAVSRINALLRPLIRSEIPILL